MNHNTKILWVIPFTLLLLFSCGNTSVKTVVSDLNQGNISAQELKFQIRTKTPLLILDIRQPSQYRNGHIPKSINVPSYEIKAYVRDHNVQTVTMILIAQSQAEAKQALKDINAMGYKDVKILSGGIHSWDGNLEF